MLRLFIATPVEPTSGLRRVLRAVGELQGGRAPAARAVHGDQLHVTYRFLGDVEDAAADAVQHALAAEDWAQVSPIEAHFERLGRFPPNGKRVRVVYAEPDDQATTALEAIAERIDACLDSLGDALPPDALPPRDHAFTSHVTLARVNPRRHLPPDVQRRLHTLLAQPIAGGHVARLDRVALIESTLGPDGPTYRTRWEAQWGTER